MKTYMIVNGPMHGCPLECTWPEGTEVDLPVASPVRQYPPKVDPNYTRPSYTQTFLLQGDFAYYMGEKVSYGGKIQGA